MAQLADAQGKVDGCQAKIAELTYKISEIERDATLKSWNIDRKYGPAGLLTREKWPKMTAYVFVAHPPNSSDGKTCLYVGLQAELEAAYKELNCVKSKLRLQETELDSTRLRYSDKEDDHNFRYSMRFDFRAF